MANFGTRKGHVSPTQLFLLNVIVHSIALFLSYGFYFGSNNSISSLNIEIYMILGTICWLLLLKLSKITNIKKFMKKWTLDLYSKWINCFGIIRILVFVFFFISIFWNDYLRLVVCSYLSALSIVQYSESQHPALQYSSESIVTTGADRNHKDESQVGSDSTVYPISSNENILRQRRNIAPPPVPPNYSKSTIRMKYPEPQAPTFTPVYKIQHTEKPKLDYSAPVVENAQLESDSLHPVTTKRKLDDIHSENESSDLPLKKASTTVEVSSNLISNDEVQSSSSAFVDLDSKKRQREHSQSNVIVEENDDIARTRKISRTSQQNPNDGNLSGSIISPARPNIHKPLISLHHIPSEISCQQVDNKESDPQKTYIRPALKSRHAVSIEQYSKKRSMSFEVEDSLLPEKSGSEHDRLIATLAMNRKQLLEATETLLKNAVGKKDQSPVVEKPSMLQNIQNKPNISAVSMLPNNQNTSTYQPQAENNSIPENVSSISAPLSASNAKPFVFGASSSNHQFGLESSSKITTTPPPPKEKTSDSNSLASPPTFELERAPSVSMKKPPPSPTVRKTSFDEKRNGIAFLPSSLNPLPAPAEAPAEANQTKVSLSSSSTVSTEQMTPAPTSSGIISSKDNHQSVSSNFKFGSSDSNNTKNSAVLADASHSTGFSFGAKPSSNPSPAFGSFGSSNAPMTSNADSATSAKNSQQTSANSTNSVISQGFSFGAKPSSTPSPAFGSFGSSNAPMTSKPNSSATTSSTTTFTSGPFSFGQSSGTFGSTNSFGTPKLDKSASTLGGFGTSTTSTSFGNTALKPTISTDFRSTSGTTSTPSNPFPGFGSNQQASSTTFGAYGSPPPKASSSSGLTFAGSTTPGSTSNISLGMPSTSTFGSTAPLSSASGKAFGQAPFGGSNFVPSNGFNSHSFNTPSLPTPTSGAFSMGTEHKSDRKKVKPKFHTKK